MPTTIPRSVPPVNPGDSTSRMSTVVGPDFADRAKIPPPSGTTVGDGVALGIRTL